MYVNNTSFHVPQKDTVKKQTQQNISPVQPQQKNEIQAPSEPKLYAAYNNISFKGRPYDGTHFREELEKRAQKSTVKLKTDGEERVLTLYKTQHHEYVLDPVKNKIFKLKYVDNKDRITQQIMASKLYKSVGVRAPEYLEFEKDGKTGWLAEVFEEELFPAQTNKKALYESFVADVWLGNRNGLSKDNTRIDKDGNPVKMSVSGSLGYRASGKPKDKPLYYEIDEIKTMRDPSINPDAAKELAQMTDEDLYDAIEAFTSKYNSDIVNKIDITPNGQYRSQTITFEPHNVLSGRYRNLRDFIQKDKNDKILQKRGLLEEGHPQLTNLSNFDKNFNIDYESVLKITDEQWETLKKRGLFSAKPGLKKFSTLDYTYLAQMTDEQHETALRRGLYAPRKSDKEMYGNIGGAEIFELSKLTDKQWKNVEKRNLLDVKVNHYIKNFWAYEFINQVADMSDIDWYDVEYSGILDTGVYASQLYKMLETSKSDDAKNLVPSYLSRVRALCNIEKDVKYQTQKNFTAEYVLSLAGLDNDKWQLLMEITKDLTDIKMSPSNLSNVMNFDDDTIDTLRKRNLLTTAKITIGLEDLALLYDEEWANVKKRKLNELKQFHYDDWAYLAALTDEQFKLAQDKKLFEDRAPLTKSERPYSGEEISLLVNTLDEKGWENFEKRGLYNNFYVFNGFYYGAANGRTAAKLALYSDKEFERFKNIQNSVKSYIYPSTVMELVNLNDTEYKRLMDRNLFKYINTHEAWDNYMEDAPVMTALAQLDDGEYETFLNMKNDCKTIAAKTLIIKADKLRLNEKENINELSFKEKKEYLKLLLNKHETLLSKDFQNNYNCTGLIPKNVDELSSLITKLVKSAGIDTRPLEKSEKTAFFNALDKLSSADSEFKNLELKNPDFKLTVQYSRDEFINDIKELVKNLDKKEQMKVWDYFGFEISSDSLEQTVMSGYPALINNGEKLMEINNPQTKEVIEKIKPYVKKFTLDNKVLPDGRFVSPQMAQTFNDMLNALPELYSLIGKKQHGTHDYTVDVHTLAVMQECVKNPYFGTLNTDEKKELMFAALLHDITKAEYRTDKSHPQNSAYDAYFLLKKFDLQESERQKIYQLIKNHDMMAHCSMAAKEGNLDRLIRKYAYELRFDNLSELELMLTKADLMSVKRNGAFWEKTSEKFKNISKKLKDDALQLRNTAIALPQTRIPKASELKPDGVNVKEVTTTDENGNEIKNKVVYLEKGLDLSKYGFDKGVTAENFNVIVHGFDNNIQQVMLDALELPDSDALLSTSYIFYDKGNYHTFRQQGFIKNIPSDNIGVAYYRDFGSGCRKTEEMLINDYLSDNGNIYRKYFSELLKKELNLSDEEYHDLYKKIKDKPIEQIEKEIPYAAYAIKNIFSKMEIHKRKFKRDYNEILVGKGKTTGVFFEGTDSDGNKYKIENIPEFLRKYAQDNNLPIIYFGE